MLCENERLISLYDKSSHSFISIGARAVFKSVQHAVSHNVLFCLKKLKAQLYASVMTYTTILVSKGFYIKLSVNMQKYDIIDTKQTMSFTISF